MRSRWLINLLLLAAIGLLALVALYEPGIEPEPETQTVTALQQGQIDTIRIHRPPRDDLVLARGDHDEWFIEGQTRLPAEPFQVNALLRLAEQAAARSYPASGLDLVKLGLDPPRASVMLGSTQVDFGVSEPLGGLRYVRVGDQVHLTPDIYQYLIDADFTQFVRRQLLPAQAAIRGLRVPAFALTKTGHDWEIEPQQELTADRVQQLIDNWQQASALRVKGAAVTAGGERIEVLLDDPAQPLVFLITAREPELVLLRPDLGIEYHMGDLGDSLLAFPQPATEQAQ
jgi:hypothetical protein